MSTPPNALLLQAEEFLRSADATRAKHPKDRLVILYLYGHAVELALKAVQLASGVSHKSLKKDFGHDIAMLVDAMKPQASNKKPLLTLLDRDELIFKALSPDYRAKRLEYVQYETIYSGPKIPDLRDACHRLMCEVNVHLRKSRVSGSA